MDRPRRLTAGPLALPGLVGLLYVLTALDADVARPTAALGAVVGAALGVLLVGRNERSLRVAVAVAAGDLLYHALVPGLVIPFAGLVALWAVTLHRPPRRSLLVLAGVSATGGLNALRGAADDTIFTLLLGLSVWALAEAARNRVGAAEESARRALADERARIARELHDVVAHGVSVIVVQAAAAGDVFDAHPEAARAALGDIERAGREALAELRRLVAAVRPGDELPSGPQPGVAMLGALAAQLRSAGLEVVVHEDGRPFPLPAGVDLSAYRIVQEALTNTLRHAEARTAEVTLRYAPGRVELDVVDDGRTAALRPGGMGLRGMAERAAMVGGELEAGPTAHGGFRVRARLPVEAAG